MSYYSHQRSCLIAASQNNKSANPKIAAHIFMIVRLGLKKLTLKHHYLKKEV